MSIFSDNEMKEFFITAELNINLSISKKESKITTKKIDVLKDLSIGPKQKFVKLTK
jgi:hypothetical protein